LNWRICFAVTALIILALNLYPVSYREILMHAYIRAGRWSPSLVRSQFYAGLVSMAGMGLLNRRQGATAPLAVSRIGDT